MAMSKAQLQAWPWNNQPSARHVWKETWTSTSQAGNYSSQCQRCERHFNAFADARGPVYCYPTIQWMVGNPDDDGKTG